MWTPFTIAVQLLTRGPIPSSTQPSAAEYGRSVLAYPLIGLLIGLALAALQWLLAPTPSLLQSALLLTLWVGLTGALHLDGVGDMADAWVGGHGDRERTLTIMKDPVSGPMGVTAVVLLLLIKVAALSVVIDYAEGGSTALALMVAPLLGRGALVAGFLFMPYARPQGLGSAHARELPQTAALAVLLLSGALPALALGWTGVAATAAGVSAFLLLRRSAMQRLGGLTGDVAGALCEAVEAAALVALALVLSWGTAA